MDFSWIDILFAVILVWCLIEGMIKGMIKTVISFFLTIAAVIIAKIFTPQATAFLKTNTKLYTNLCQTITKKMALVFTDRATTEAVTDSANLHNIPSSLLRFLGKFVDSTNKTIGTTAEAFGQNAADIIMNVIAFAAIFLLAIIVGKIICMILDKVMKLPVLNFFNHMGGMILGLLKGVVLVALLATAFYSLNVFLQAEILSTAINNSVLIKYFYLSFLFR